MPRTIVALTLTALAALAIAFGWACMPFGAGLSPDSVVYIAMADGAWTPRGFSLPYGYNLYEPVRHFPPLYPAVLGGGKLIGLAAAPFSRIVGCALLGLNTALVGWIVYRSSRGRIGAAMAASILFGVSVPILTIHVMAWSEPLFIALLLIGMLGLSEYLVGARRMWLLIGCLAIGGSAVTRYAGIAAVTATVTLLTCHAKSGRQWRDALVGGLCATLPIATWLWRNYRAAGDLTGRDFEFHLAPLYRELPHVVATILSWFCAHADALPDQPRAFVGVSICLIVTYALCRNRRSTAGAHESALVRICVIFAVCYSGLLIATLTFFDADTPLDNRLLCPLHITLLISLVLTLSRWTSIATPVLRSAAVLSVAGYIALNLGGLQDWFADAQRDGRGYASESWRHSPLLAFMRALPSSMVIYATAPNPVYLYVGRSSLDLPLKPTTRRGPHRLRYARKLSVVRQQVLHREAAAAYFYAQIDPGFPTLDDLLLSLGPPRFATAEGIVWAAGLRHLQ